MRKWTQTPLIREMLRVIRTMAERTVVARFGDPVGVVPIVVAAIPRSLRDANCDWLWQQHAQPSAKTEFARAVQRPWKAVEQRQASHASHGSRLGHETGGRCPCRV